MSGLLRVECYHDAIAAPAQYDPSQLSAFHGHFGGAYRADGTYIELTRMWRAIDVPVVYPASANPGSVPAGRLSGTTLFAGPLFDDFGHFLLESTARLWPCFVSQVDHILFQFPGKSGQRPHTYQETVLGNAGLLDRVIVTDQAYQVEKLVVPQSAASLADYIKPEFLLLFDNSTLGGCITETPAKQIYVSQTHLKIGATIGEAYLESAFANVGFDIIHTDEMTMDQQIDAFRTADTVVGIQGLALYNVLYCRPGTSIVVLIRDPSTLKTFQMIDAIRGLSTTYVEVLVDSIKGFPSSHTQGPFLLDFFRLCASLRDIGLIRVVHRLRMPSHGSMLEEFQKRWRQAAAQDALHPNFATPVRRVSGLF